MLENPIIFLQDNLVFNKNKECWAVFEVYGYDYDLLSDEYKIDLLKRLARFVSSVQIEAKLLIIPIRQDIKEHFKSLKNKDIGDENLKLKRQYLLDLTENYLEEELQTTKNINDYKTYISVKLNDRGDFNLSFKLNNIYEYFIKNPINAINVALNLEEYDIMASEISKYIYMSDKFVEDNRRRLNIQPVTIKTLQWILRRSMFRGMEKDIKEFYRSNESVWTPHSEIIEIGKERLIRPYKNDVINLFSGIIRKKGRYVEIEHNSNEKSYQTYLSITNMPDVMSFPGCEWLYMLQKHNSQAEVCIHIKNTKYRDALKKIELKTREADSQIKNIEESDSDIPSDLLESKLESRLIEDEIKGGRTPLSAVSVTICVSDDNLENLEQRAELIKIDFEDLNFIVERSYTDQLKLFFQSFPCSGHGVRDYIMNATPVAIASGIFGASNVLGDEKGEYIGTTGQSKKNVFLNLAEACLSNMSASAYVSGGLGFGKSFNMNILVHLVFMSGGYVLIFDPKGERGHWNEFDLYKDYINIITLGGDDVCNGMLDPYNIYLENIEEANNLALNIISELFKIKPKDEEYIVLLESFRRLTEYHCDKRASMKLICEIMNNFDDADDLKPFAQKLARKLELLQQAGLSKLIFGDGTEESITLDSRINILQIQNLTLPSPNISKDDYTQEETLSTVLMLIMANFAKKFALKKRSNFSLVFFDESWMLGKTTEGIKLYDFLARMGRSLYTGCIFNGHSILDIPTEGIKNTITYKFCFNTNSVEEAKRVLAFLNLQVTDDNINLVRSLENGQCLFQDASRRVGILTFDYVFEDLKDLFSTTPTENQGSDIHRMAEKR